MHDDDDRLAASPVLMKYRLDKAEQDLKDQQAEIDKLEAEFEQFRETIAAKDRKILLAGVYALGLAVTTLVGVIWSYRAVIFLR